MSSITVRLMAALGLSSAMTLANAQTVFINEIHYDNAGTDAGEAVEIAGPAGTSLSGWSIVRYNGNNPAAALVYNTPAGPSLSGTIPDQGNGYGTLSFSFPQDGLQNGANDGIALVNPSNVVVQLISYEGVFTASGGPAAGTTSVDIGVAETSTTPAGFSLQLSGSGTQYGDFTWVAASASSFGSVNAGQTFAGLPPPPPPFACGDTHTRIHAIQGAGSTSPMVGMAVDVEGIVVGDFQGTAYLSGFYLQQADGEEDGDPATSEGLFVFDNGSAIDVAPGDRVRVRGTVAEFGTSGATLTEIASVSNVAVCSTGNVVNLTSVSLPVATLEEWERYEGMHVFFTQPLTVTGNFTLGRFGEVDLASSRLMTPTNVVLPGTDAILLQNQNDRSRIVLDDANTQQNRDPVAYPEGGGLNASPLRNVRVGDVVGGAATPVVGVLDQRFGIYRVQPTQAVVFGPSENPRALAPAPVGGTVRVASFNVLNYFTTIDSGSPVCGPAGGMDCRGADSTAEFVRQRAKIIAALAAIDAHVVGLIELENNPTASLDDLVAGLNAATSPGRYAYVNAGTIGSDAIKVGLIYQPAVVQPVGSHAILDSGVDPAAITTLNRPALAQTFARSGSRSDLQQFVVAVNHFKSKGSSCSSPANPGEIADPDTGDGQGNCNLTRLSMANALSAWLAANPTGDTTPAASRKVIIVGDLNAYAKEDPIRALEGAGYANLIARHVGADAYSYQFSGQSGYLDHALGNAAARRQVTGVTEWHINADEPIVFDYNVEFKSAGQVTSFYAADAYRSSDHDPVIVGFNPLCGDLNDDGQVGSTDQAILRSQFGQPVSNANRRLDFDEDNRISLNDYRVWYGCYRAFVTP